MNRDFSSVLCFKKDDAKRYPTTNSSQTVPGFVCPKEIFKNRLTNFYSIKTQNETYVRFECLLNFHLKTGSYHSVCINGTWFGDEPLCEVDYYKDRIRLSSMIVLLCLFVSLLFLGGDFCLFMKKRLEVRQENARVRAFTISRMIKYDNMRCTAYPNHGLNDIKLYIPELQQFIGIKPKDYRPAHRESHLSDLAYDEEFFQSHAAAKSQTDDKRQDKFTRGLFLFRMRSRKSTYPT